MRNRMGAIFLVLAGIYQGLACSEVYEVGLDKPYTSVGQVPWESLAAGDRVRIFWRPEPYREKWVLNRQGTEESRIVVEGVPSATGALPVIDGRDATTRSELNFWNENRGVIKIGGSNRPPDGTPAWIEIANLEIRGGRPPYQFTGRDGLSNYVENCAAIYIEKGEHLTIRNCILRDCGNGLFSGHLSSDLLVEGCQIYDNGIEDSIYEHNNYTESNGIVFQYNRFGPLRDGCLGNNLKDRSAGTVIRYNWIEGGNRQLDLVETDYEELASLPAYRSTRVYGNFLIEPEDAGNRQICHYGGDGGDESLYRKGVLYFYHNTLVSLRSDRTTLLRLSTNDETCDCRNNILYTLHDGTGLAMLDATGLLRLRANWTKPGWKGSHGTLTGTILDEGGNLSGASPEFLSEVEQDYRLAPASACIDAGTALAEAFGPEYAVDREYAGPGISRSRTIDEAPDLGAYEFVSSSPPGISCY